MGAGTGAVSTPPPAPIVSAAQQAAATPPPQLSSEQVKQAMEKLKVAVAPMAQNLQFSMDQGSGQTVITVVDTNTKEIIRQIPSEEMLQRSRTLDKLQGLLLNHKA
ncbi:MAG: flagellar protein FlaG [Proteobacteria bacterium]|nr:flagellar protein FlaG [Pseudomonadota bacterium]